MKDIKIALVQMNSTSDRKQNMDHIAASVKEAVAHGAAFIVFPEVVDYFGPDLPGHATKVPGAVSEWISDLAREYQVWIHGGSITVEEDGHIYNRSLLYDPKGKLQASYDKLHMFDVEVEGRVSYRESDDITPGKSIALVDTPFGKVGLGICYDIRFPQMFVRMADEGMEILVICANFADATGQAHWEPILRARAIENSCYVLACDQCGVKPGFHSHGHSMVIDPWGKIIAKAEDEPVILYADLDGEFLNSCRKQIPSLQNRRHDMYD